MMYITEEQMGLVNYVHDNCEMEFKTWADQNESELMKWYDEQGKMSIFEAAMKFAYYCANEFMKSKTEVIAED